MLFKVALFTFVAFLLLACVGLLFPPFFYMAIGALAIGSIVFLLLLFKSFFIK